MANLDHFRITNLPKQKDPIKELIKELSGTAQAKFMKDELGEGYKYYQQLRNIVAQKGIQARMPYDIEIQ